MARFQEAQIQDRVALDDAQLAEASYGLASVLMGSTAARHMLSEQARICDAVDELCHYYGIVRDSDIEFGEGLDEGLERLLRPSGVMWRQVRLEGTWWKNACEAMLCKTVAGDYVALIPTLGGYRFFDYGSGRKLKVNGRTAKLLEGDAICFYRPLPNDATGFADIARFLFKRTDKFDVVLVVLATLATALVGLILPWINEFIFSRVIPAGHISELGAIAALLLGASVAGLLFTILKNLAEMRITTKLQIIMESAIFGKLINMPPAFFKRFSSGDLSNRVNVLGTIASLIANVAFTASFASIFSVVYVAQIFTIAPELVLPALAAIVLQLVVGLLNVRVNKALTRRRLPVSNKISAIVFSLFSGIQKIRLAGGEKRAFAKWAQIYKGLALCDYNPPVLLKLMPALTTLAGLVGMMLIYYFAASSGLDVPHYFAFMTAYGMVSGALISIVGIVNATADIDPILETASPLLTEPSELSEQREILRSLRGVVRIEGLSFSYNDEAPPILDNFNLNIRRGEYLAIVGKTGCGKSTLLRLLLGFEAPQAGAIYYDERDMAKLDLKSLRGNMGVVLQNAGLFQGDIFSNISISAPQITLKEAWDAAEMAGVAEDIRAMPMGMRTMVSEGSGGLSGGQKQRIMIARAIASKPSILMFDEATSALDNITQRQVSDSLAGLKSTRIIIAHRLSTIKEADRIVVLDGGTVVEDGSYDELIEQGGLFAELVRRQQLA
ncbi:MAG: ATP-binding cassette domain-containing protein [Coriobacteriales bacterium]|jgi:NHLM bacteriocin system ABC transporter ATP-binding protein|nr:ATP-binding cassette domain-containing protein [Coriobacteriales bacterium]